MSNYYILDVSLNPTQIIVLYLLQTKWTHEDLYFKASEELQITK